MCERKKDRERDIMPKSARKRERETKGKYGKERKKNRER